MTTKNTAPRPFANAPVVGAESDSMTELRRLVQALKQAEDELATKTAELETAKADLATLRDDRVPAHAKDMGFTGGNIVGLDGLKLDLKLGVFGGLKELGDDQVARAAAFAYLEELKEGPAIKRVLVISMGKDSAPVAMRIRQGIDKVSAAMGVAIEVEEKVDIHHSTLSKIARDRLEGGENIDLAKLGLVRVVRAYTKR